MEATVILQRCGKSGRTFGVRCEKMQDGEWHRTWAFPIDENRARHEGYDKTEIKSHLPATDDYPGCPYCGCQGAFYDYNCGKISCYYGEKVFTCPWCSNTYNAVTTTEKMSLSGGDV